MRKVMFKGTEYTVESWAQYIAMDDDGEVYMYENEPKYNEVMKVWLPGFGECKNLGNVNCLKIFGD